MSSNASEKTEQPTARRLREARKQGQVASSRDFVAAFSFLAGFGVLAVGAGHWFVSVRLRFSAMFVRAFDRVEMTLADALTIVDDSLIAIVMHSLPVASAALAVGCLAGYLQTGGLVAAGQLAPKLERLDPIQGLKKLFAMRTAVEFGKTWIKLALAASAALSAAAAHATVLLDGRGGGHGLDPFFAGWEVVRSAALRAGGVLAVLGAVDILIQQRLLLRDLRMTKDEVKRDYKEEEGDPHIKSARRHIHRELSETEVAAATAQATLVVVNPTHIATALRYDAEMDEVPRLVAKGTGRRARAIRATAARAGIGIVHNKPLARSLFRLPVDSEIPESLYVAVAEVLAFIGDVAHETSNAKS